ncbi:MAG: trypsin-like peptidase domain-containing protein, partial [Fimbriiglobus sp.]|nr:trypsin-like peptidase domain-containing protein [Fimbriiglobus sp.]
MRVRCPECDFRVRVPDDDEDARVKCPECGERFRPSDLDDGDDDEPQSRRTDRGRSGKRTPAKASNSQMLILFGVLGGVGVLVLGGIAVVVAITMNRGGAVAKGTTAKMTPAPVKPVTPPRPVPVSPTTSRFGPEPPTQPQPQPQPPFGPQPGNPFPQPPSNGFNPPPSPFPPGMGPGGEMPGGNPGGSGSLPNAGNSDLDDLFRQSVDKPPPNTKVAVLACKKDESMLAVPTFHSLLVANKLVRPSAQTKLTLDEVKQATVYIKVDAGELSGTGSGFYIGSENGAALVATNHHVIEAAAKRVPANAKRPKITCVFNSGVPADERLSLAQVVASDPVADLAVLRLENPPAKLPKPLNPWATPKLTETMEVRICGFPFGEQLATATTNPNISVNNGSVSSLRLNKVGGLDKVQINGSINPGNSGGPIVDKDGRLVGVAVSTIKGSGLGFAVPVDELIALLEGKILFTEFLPAGIDGATAKFKVVVPVMDPRTRVKTVYVRYWAGKGVKPRAVKDAQLGHRPIENAQEIALKLPDVGTSLTVATGDLKLPADATEVVIQIGSEQMPAPGQARGLIAVSAPVDYKLSVKGVPNGSDTRPLAEVFRNPAALAGQTVVARGKVVQPPSGIQPREVISVSDVSGRATAGVKFVVDRESAVQFDEVDPEIRGNDVRLVCVVGKRGADGLVPVRVARCDFLDEVDVVTRTVPEADTTDTLAALNRNPTKFNGKTVTVTAAAALQSLVPLPRDSFRVLFDNLAFPRSVQFQYTPVLARKVAELRLKPNGLFKVRLTGGVSATSEGGMATVSVSKVEVLDPT